MLFESGYADLAIDDYLQRTTEGPLKGTSLATEIS